MIRQILIITMLSMMITIEAMEKQACSDAQEIIFYKPTDEERAALENILGKYTPFCGVKDPNFKKFLLSKEGSPEKDLEKFVGLFHDYRKGKESIDYKHEHFFLNYINLAFVNLLKDEKIIRDNKEVTYCDYQKSEKACKALNYVATIVDLTSQDGDMQLLGWVPGKSEICSRVKEKINNFGKQFDIQEGKKDTRALDELIEDLITAGNEQELNGLKNNHIGKSDALKKIDAALGRVRQQQVLDRLAKLKQSQQKQESKFSIMKNWVKQHKFITTIGVLSLIGGIFLWMRK